MELDDALVDTASTKRAALDPIARMAAEQEEFLQDLEQDKDMRSTINIYKDPSTRPLASSAMQIDDGHSRVQHLDATGSTGDGDEQDDEDYPEVPIEELLDGLVLEDEPGAPQPPPDVTEDEEQ